MIRLLFASFFWTRTFSTLKVATEVLYFIPNMQARALGIVYWYAPKTTLPSSSD